MLSLALETAGAQGTQNSTKGLHSVFGPQIEQNGSTEVAAGAQNFLGGTNKLKIASIAATVPIKRSHCAHQILPLCHQTQPLCPSNSATVPSNAATVPIKRSHCAHQTLPLCPSNAATVPSNAATVPSNAATVPNAATVRMTCCQCAQQMLPVCPTAHHMLPVCPSNPASVPTAHHMLPVCPSNAASVPIKRCQCTPAARLPRPIAAPVVSANQGTGNRLKPLIGGEAVQC
ncbi:hypothetical protein AB205_0170720 [Aquarana catesbeiana]|uniref:Uncharacterized protein n=1 Tax=Aquarana catesbeiana TaxID=8400 RepID=A0A2G9R661_AQUCT|nr:hypothetical protein AB205_0170720 [Aquarana catesbeiana]